MVLSPSIRTRHSSQPRPLTDHPRGTLSNHVAHNSGLFSAKVQSPRGVESAATRIPKHHLTRQLYHGDTSVQSVGSTYKWRRQVSCEDHFPNPVAANTFSSGLYLQGPAMGFRRLITMPCAHQEFQSPILWPQLTPTPGSSSLVQSPRISGNHNLLTGKCIGNVQGVQTHSGQPKTTGMRT